MSNNKVVIVHLRRPGKDDPRSDPFWEFGSFGVTGCHARNLLHPKSAHKLIGVRLAFAQGGKLGTRLVFLSPGVRKINGSEALWSPCKMPFRYSDAPLLINKRGETDFPRLRKTLLGGNRSTLVGQFSSNFRSCKQPLEEAIAREIVNVYEDRRKSAGQNALAKNYVEALPGDREFVSRQERIRCYEEYLEKGCKLSPQPLSGIQGQRVCRHSPAGHEVAGSRKRR